MTLEETKSQSRKPKGKRNKFGASKSGGYDSEREHRRDLSLKAKLRDGLITDLREQVSFILIPVQRDAEGNLLEHDCRYIADFVYRDRKGDTIVEDTKGVRTPEYIIKRKLMLLVYGIRIKEV